MFVYVKTVTNTKKCLEKTQEREMLMKMNCDFYEKWESVLLEELTRRRERK